MPGDDPFAFVAPAERKPLKKPHWREKLFSRDKNKHNADQQVEAFLGPTRSKSLSVSQGLPPTAATPRGLPTSRIDVSSHRWPSSQDLPNTAPPLNSATNEHFQSHPLSMPPWKSRPRPGLKVQFNGGEPEVIGEGGDESEVPTIEISMYRARPRRRGTGTSQASDSSAQPENFQATQPQLRLDTTFEDADGRVPRGTTLQRKDTTAKGLHPSDWKPLLQNPQDADFLMTLNLGQGGSRLSFRASPESNSFAQRVRAKMQAEEGRALQSHQDDRVPLDNDDGDTYRAADMEPDSPSSYETPPLSETEEVPPANPLRSPETPVMHMQGSPSPIDTHSAYDLTPAGTLPNLSSPKSQPMVSPPKPHALPSPPKPQVMHSPTKSQTMHSPPKPSAIPIDPALNEQSRPSSRDNRDLPRNPQPPKISLRSVANQFGDSAFADFKAYIAQYADLIRLSAEGVKPLMETSLTEWMRAGVWWFMRGKKRLEAYARSRPSSSGGGNNLQGAKQAVIDLGKALWINESIVPQHNELARYGKMSIEALIAVVNTTGDKQMADLLGLHQALLNHLRSLTMSIKRNNILSVLASNGDSVGHADTSVWLRYPFFAPDVSAVLSGSASRSMLIDQPGKGQNMAHMMPLGDTSRHFSYGSMFVDVCVSSSEDDSQQFSMPCVLSIIRDRGDWYVLAAICSQSELVNTMIQSDRKQGPTWDDVDWQVRTNSMNVKLPRGFELDITFQEDDFKTLWNIVKYTTKTEASLSPEAGENIIYESTLKVFQYMDPGTPKAFPVEPIDRCRLRLFERYVTVTEGTGTRSVHQGFRLAVLTSPKVKTLSSANHILGFGTPVVFGLLRGEDGAPALLLKVKEDGRTRSMLMTFHEVQERTTMHSLLLGMLTRETESKTPDIAMRAYSIEQPADKQSGRAAVTHLQFPAGTVSVIDQEHAFVDHGYGPTILSEHLRAFIATEWGSATDRINLGPGELKLGLDVNNRTGLSLYRPGQKDLTVSVAENLVRPEMPDTLSDFLQTAMVKPMIRRFDFASLKDLHAFEAAVTGFKVLFDSVACYFTVSRRRMVVPISKKWESSLARIQIVQQEKVIQLLAFFNDFNHGKCMNFVLKGTDTLESFGRSGKFCTRIVDAKFALPKTEDDPASDFVCLDMPDYPIEHDDIAIGFDSESDRANFQAAAPGTVREPSRMGSLRR
ncbi:hypothetical protein AWENTII_012101 [Aspergillus wentii]|nr:hypothetical protein MW887_005586 [Aspergillus wentii]